MSTRPQVCILSSGRKANDERIYYKIARSLRKRFERVVIAAPGEPDHRFDDGIEFRKVERRRSRFNRWGTWRSLYHVATLCDAEVFQCEELDAWLIGWLVARRTGARLVFDAHEFNPAEITIGSRGLVRWVLWRVVVALDRFLVKRTDRVLVANDIVRAYYLILHRFARVAVLHNSPVLGLFRGADPPPRKEYLLCHEGSLGFSRGLKSLVRVVERLRSAGVNAKLLIVGDVYGKERAWLEHELSRSDLIECVDRTGWLQYPKVGEAIERCEIGLITMEPTPSNMLCGLPNKLFNYMRYGLPVVAPDFPEIARVVSSEQCGLIYQCGDSNGLFEAVGRLAHDESLRRRLGEAGRAAIQRRYAWELMEPVLFEAYCGLGSEGPDGRAGGAARESASGVRP